MASKEQNALELMKASRSIAQRIADSADAYLGDMETRPRPAIEIGKFYKTFDGSLVYLARRKNACRCPRCMGQTQMPSFLAQLFGPEHTAAAEDDAAPELVAVVIRGGHGISGYPGEEAGDRYIVDGAGWTLFNGVDASKATDPIAPALLSVAGMSLASELQAAFTAVQPAAARP